MIFKMYKVYKQMIFDEQMRFHSALGFLSFSLTQPTHSLIFNSNIFTRQHSNPSPFLYTFNRELKE